MNKAIFLAFLCLIISCKKQKISVSVTIENPYIKENNKIDSIYILNNKLSKSLILNSSKIYENYTKLIWLSKNINEIDKEIFRKEIEYYKVRKEIEKEIIRTKIPSSKKQLGLNSFDRAKANIETKLFYLTEIITIQSLLRVQMKTISPILKNEYNENNWTTFDNKKVINQTKSYLDKIKELDSLYRNIKIPEKIEYIK